jgi:hypothetical protein
MISSFTMKISTRLLALIVLSACAFAADNFRMGSWKLNAAKSVVDGPLPSFIHEGTMALRPRPEAPVRVQTGPVFLISEVAGAKAIFQAAFSPDGRTLTLSQVEDTQHHAVLVLDKQ